MDGLHISKEREEIKNIIGYMGDTPFLYGKLNAFEFLNFVGSFYSIPEKELTKRVDILLDLLGLKEKCYYLIETYSFGMKRKLSFAASVIHKPKVLLLDEPLDGVDPESAFVIKSILKSFTRNDGAVILATHVLEVAQKICTRLGIINRGEFIALGTMEEIKKSSSFTELEDIFLELTGGERYREVLDYLGKEENLYNLF